MPASSNFRTVRCPRARSSRPLAGVPTRDGVFLVLAAAFGTAATLPDLTSMSGSFAAVAARSIPAPGTAELPAANAAALLRRNGTDPSTAARLAVRFDDRSITHAEFLAESIRWANLFLAQPPSTPDGVLHVGVLLDNTPDYLFALGVRRSAGRWSLGSTTHVATSTCGATSSTRTSA